MIRIFLFLQKKEELRTLPRNRYQIVAAPTNSSKWRRRPQSRGLAIVEFLQQRDTLGFAHGMGIRRIVKV